MRYPRKKERSMGEWRKGEDRRKEGWESRRRGKMEGKK